jgi:shikimate dehydrogenase
MKFGLLGKKLSHSFSKKYFEEKFLRENLKGHTYTNFEIANISEFPDLLKQHPDLSGLNVTVPYKEEIIPFLNSLDEVSSEAGAVNCIKIENGRTGGFNTDVYGFRQSIKPFLEPKHDRALIFGTGGSSKAVAYALKKAGIDFYFVSSSAKKTYNTFFYKELNSVIFSQFRLLINCTPLGMYPDVGECPDLPYEFITEDHLAYDLIYNPEQTLFLKKCSEKGAITINGLSMLHLQAEKSWEIWTKA